MEDKQNNTAGRTKLILVLSVVLIFCSGNALGILLGVIFWKKTGSIGLAVGSMLAITIIAFLLAMAVVLMTLRQIKSAPPSEPQAKEVNKRE